MEGECSKDVVKAVLEHPFLKADGCSNKFVDWFAAQKLIPAVAFACLHMQPNTNPVQKFAK